MGERHTEEMRLLGPFLLFLLAESIITPVRGEKQPERYSGGGVNLGGTE